MDRQYFNQFAQGAVYSNNLVSSDSEDEQRVLEHNTASIREQRIMDSLANYEDVAAEISPAINELPSQPDSFLVPSDANDSSFSESSSSSESEQDDLSHYHHAKDDDYDEESNEEKNYYSGDDEILVVRGTFKNQRLKKHQQALESSPIPDDAPRVSKRRRVLGEGDLREPYQPDREDDSDWEQRRTITSITPSAGDTAGGYNLTISGSSLGLYGGQVVVGASACNVTMQNHAHFLFDSFRIGRQSRRAGDCRDRNRVPTVEYAFILVFSTFNRIRVSSHGFHCRKRVRHIVRIEFWCFRFANDDF